MILLTEVRETPTSCDSRLVDLRSDVSKQALTSWTCAGVVAVKGGPLRPLLLFLTVPSGYYCTTLPSSSYSTTTCREVT